jgi:hypothetical protein
MSFVANTLYLHCTCLKAQKIFCKSIGCAVRKINEMIDARFKARIATRTEKVHDIGRNLKDLQVMAQTGMQIIRVNERRPSETRSSQCLKRSNLDSTKIHGVISPAMCFVEASNKSFKNISMSP